MIVNIKGLVFCNRKFLKITEDAICTHVDEELTYLFIYCPLVEWCLSSSPMAGTNIKYDCASLLMAIGSEYYMASLTLWPISLYEIYQDTW